MFNFYNQIIMKKITIFAVIAALLSGVLPQFACAQTKAQMKEAKKQAKSLAKEGWRTEGGHHTIEYYLVQYYMLEGENELVQGRSSGLANTKVASSQARINAAQEYVRLNTAYFVGAGAEMQGKIGEETIDNAVYGALSGFGGSIKGNLSISFLLYKENNGKYDCIAYGYVNKKKADELRKQAIESAIEDTETAKDFYDAVSNMVNVEK